MGLKCIDYNRILKMLKEKARVKAESSIEMFTQLNGRVNKKIGKIIN